MEKLNLEVSERKILGKKVKKLRREGLIPANIYGKGIASKAVQIEESKLQKIIKGAGETTLIELSLGAEKRPVLIHNIQKDPRSEEILHVDFHQVNLKEKTTASVPLKLVGEAPVEKSGVGLLLQTLNELEIEALPEDIPHEVEVDISNLTEVGQNILVKDLKIPAKVEVKNDPEATVLTVQTAQMKEEVIEEAPKPEEVEVITEKKEGEETAVGESEGGEPPKDVKEESQPQ